MKIYTNVKTENKHSKVGVVLVSDRNDVYMMKGIQLQLQDERSAHLMGIKRALSFVKLNKPLYANEDITVYTPMDSKLFFPISIEERLNSDEYIQNFIKFKNIKINHNRQAFSNFDKNMMMVAEQQIRFTRFNKSNERE